MAKKAGVGVSFRRRFSEVEKEAIREAAAAGADHEGLAKEYNTTLNTINNLVSGKTAAKKKGKRRGRPPAAEAEAGAPAKRRG
jgi:DNA-binding protein H-NS